MNMPFELLLGRKTFEIWTPYWPQHADMWPGVIRATKYVASNTVTSHEWQPSVFLSGDIAEKGPQTHSRGQRLTQVVRPHRTSSQPMTQRRNP